MKIAFISIAIGIVAILLGWVIQVSLKSMYTVLRNSLVTETNLSTQIGGFIGMTLGITVIVQLPMIAIPHIIIYCLFRYTATGVDLVHNFTTDTFILAMYAALYVLMMITAYVRDQMTDLMKYMDLSVNSGNTKQVIYVALMIVVYMILVLSVAAVFIYQVYGLTSL